MLRRIDRILLRVPSLAPAVRFYVQTLGLRLIKQDARLATLGFPDSDSEMVLHTDADLPGDAVYYLVDDVRAMHEQRKELNLSFVSAPVRAARGWRATVKDPFGNVLLIVDRTADQPDAMEDAKPAGALFAGVESQMSPHREALVSIYTSIGRTADDLPYTPHFESLYSQYESTFGEPKPTRAETWRHLLNLRKKKGILPKLGQARSVPPDISTDAREELKRLLGDGMGRRDRLPYSDDFDKLVDEFNKTQTRPLSPHLVWRLVATLAK